MYNKLKDNNNDNKNCVNTSAPKCTKLDALVTDGPIQATGQRFQSYPQISDFFFFFFLFILLAFLFLLQSQVSASPPQKVNGNTIYINR